MFGRAQRAAPRLSLLISIGDREPHEVRIDFDQWDDRLTAKVDGREVLSRFFGAGLKMSRALEFTVGTGELHTVKISKTRRLIRGSFNPQTFTISVDGRVVAQEQTRPEPTSTP